MSGLLVEKLLAGTRLEPVTSLVSDMIVDGELSNWNKSGKPMVISKLVNDQVIILLPNSR